MTQEEKAKRYDEVFNAAKEWYNNPNSSNIGKSYLYAVFPELKESEDEKIRKELIGFLRNIPNSNYTCEEMALWLEKQGEQKQETNYPKFDFDDILAIQCCMEAAKKVTEDKELYEELKCLHSRILDAYWIGKQGEQKPQGKTALEAINEEKVDNQYCVKPANKVESKFHKGQWITDGNSVLHIINMDYGFYQFEDSYDAISIVDEKYHLWTIKDAKAGDVIYSRHNTESFEWMGIFKSLDKENKVAHFYGFWHNMFKTFTVCRNEAFVLYDDFYPATKEQRDALMKAMADAGYTFDFERKELKKIKNEIEIPFGAKDSELMEESYNIPKGFHAEIDGDKVVIKKGEKPTEWSEEDENIKQWIISDIDKLFCLNKKSSSLAGKEIEWLKSLKYRVGCEANCTTTKEWSEEDIATISRVISIVKWAAYSDHSHPILNDEGATELVERLKSLKERYTWKPTWEQLDALEYHLKNTNENSWQYKEKKNFMTN